MEEIRNWVFTICGGALICGIVSALVPGKSFEKAIQLLLGVFMLFCFLTPMRLDISLPSVDVAAAEERRLAVADKTGQDTQSLLLHDMADRADTEAEALLSEYHITRSDYHLTVAETPSGEVAVQLTLPAGLSEADRSTIASKLGEKLGITVTVETQERTDSADE